MVVVDNSMLEFYVGLVFVFYEILCEISPYVIMVCML